MRITRIDIEGRQGRYATITRRRGSRWIEMKILTPYKPDGKDHRIAADAHESELWSVPLPVFGPPQVQPDSTSKQDTSVWTGAAGAAGAAGPHRAAPDGVSVARFDG